MDQLSDVVAFFRDALILLALGVGLVVATVIVYRIQYYPVKVAERRGVGLEDMAMIRAAAVLVSSFRDWAALLTYAQSAPARGVSYEAPPPAPRRKAAPRPDPYEISRVVVRPPAAAPAPPRLRGPAERQEPHF
jgi:hypothetical protein